MPDLLFSRLNLPSRLGDFDGHRVNIRKVKDDSVG
jgi:hypothetical protein